MDREKMASFLMELRRKKNLSQANLAELMGVTFQAVSKWERAEAIPDIMILEQLSILYGVTIDEIINGEAKNESSIKITSMEKPGFLNQNRIYGFWISLAYILLYFLFGFFWYLAGFNYYNILLSKNYLLGNYFVLLQFLVAMSVPILTMLFYLCKSKKSFIKMFKARKIMGIVSLCSVALLTIWLVTQVIRGGSHIFDIGVGFYFLQGLTIGYNIVCLVQKKLGKSFICEDFLDEHIEQIQEISES